MVAQLASRKADLADLAGFIGSTPGRTGGRPVGRSPSAPR